MMTDKHSPKRGTTTPFPARPSQITQPDLTPYVMDVMSLHLKHGYQDFPGVVAEFQPYQAYRSTY